MSADERHPTTRLSWLTDIHLNFITGEQIDALAERIVADDPDRVVISGDISESPRLLEHLRRLHARVGRPVSFVLGNHDYYRSSIAQVRAAVAALDDIDGLGWLPATGLVELTPRVAMVGVDGWGDARLGDWEHTTVRLNDFWLIEELAEQRDHLGVVERVRQLGEAEAAMLRPMLRQACDRYPGVIVVTHVPPFRGACWHEGEVSADDWLPWFCCKAVGDVLLEASRAHPRGQLTVLCGHTHGAGTAEIRDNLTVRTGGAEYRAPEIADVFEVGATVRSLMIEGDP